MSSSARDTCTSDDSLSSVMPMSNFSANSPFSFNVGMIEQRLALPQRSPMPFSVPWICRAPARTAASEFATACSVSLCAWMPTCAPGTCLTTSPTMRSDLVRQRAAIGVAQHHPARAGLIGRLRAGQRVVRIGLVAVEEMLAVDQHLAALRLHRRHAVADRGEVLLVGRLQRHLDVIFRRLRDEADRVRLGFQKRCDARIVRGRAAGTARHAEGGEGRGLELRIGCEEFRVGRICARIAALDVVDAEIVEHAPRSASCRAP